MKKDPDVRDRARVVVVDDHALVREALVGMLDREPDLRVCGQADNANDALELVKTMKPDLVLTDIVLRSGDGIELIKSIAAENANLPVLVVSMHDELIYAERALRAGARGYVMKDQPVEYLLEGIRIILAGDVFVSPKMNARLLRSMVRKRPVGEEAGLNHLSDRELEIFQLIGSGMRTIDIASHLGISRKTVESHRENIKVKLALKDGIALIQAATRQYELQSA